LAQAVSFVPVRQGLAIALIGIALAGCGGAAMTDLPAGHPLNPCPLDGQDAIVPREGYMLVAPGEIVVGYEAWHNETPESFACGAQSVRGGSSEIRAADYDSGFVPWVATYDRASPLAAAEARGTRALIFRTDGDQPVLTETVEPQSGPQFGALGNFEANKPVGTYRMEIRSASGELLAETTFDIVD
jgi:hypothetical protein